MELRTVRRGFSTLAIAALLGLGGAYPAAAEELGWLDRGLGWLAGLWAGEETGGWDGEGLIPIMTKGMGVDPNGGPEPGEEPPPPDCGH